LQLPTKDFGTLAAPELAVTHEVTTDDGRIENAAERATARSPIPAENR